MFVKVVWIIFMLHGFNNNEQANKNTITPKKEQPLTSPLAFTLAYALFLNTIAKVIF
jgi:hypothetical protein